MTTKEFDIGDVLSVTTLKLVSSRGMDGVQDLLSFMAGYPVFTHQIPRIGPVCKTRLLEQFPQLNDIEDSSIPSGSKEDIFEWVAQQAEKYGRTFTVTTLAPDTCPMVDPVKELHDVLSRSE